MAKFISKKVELDLSVAQKSKEVLAFHNQKYTGKIPRKLEPSLIISKLSLLKKAKDFWIRNPEDWLPKSFNFERQIYSLINWLLCYYPVPKFLYTLFNVRRNNKGELHENTQRILLEEIYLDWFITIGQGMPFKKACKDFMSKKESGLFLNAPDTNTIAGNILWSKCKVHNTSQVVINCMCSYWEERYNNRNKHIWDEIITFYARYPEITSSTVHDTMDFLYYHLSNVVRPNETFSLSGRTLNSVIELTNNWHNTIKGPNGLGYCDWEGLPIPSWKWEIEAYSDVWYISQIFDNKKLYYEGKVMKHCVGSYSYLCKAGSVGIFTVEHEYKGNRTKCLTIEVGKDLRIRQVRGKCNRSAEKDERKVIRKWAIDRQLSYAIY